MEPGTFPRALSGSRPEADIAAENAVSAALATLACSFACSFAAEDADEDGEKLGSGDEALSSGVCECIGLLAPLRGGDGVRSGDCAPRQRSTKRVPSLNGAAA